MPLRTKVSNMRCVGGLALTILGFPRATFDIDVLIREESLERSTGCRMEKIEMSSEAITRRLRQTEQLRRLSLSLMKAKILTDTEAAELRKKNREKRRGEVAKATG